MSAQPYSGPDPCWNPRPHPDLATVSRSAYHAGYSDAYHGYSFGSGQHGDFSDYRVGYNHGCSDGPSTRAADADEFRWPGR